MIGRQVPAGAVTGDVEPMSGAQMSAESLCTKSALEANNIILLHRNPLGKAALRGGAG